MNLEYQLRYREKAYHYEHVLIAERVLGKSLPLKAHVHHVNGRKKDNRHRNLVICENGEYHGLLHVRSRVVRAGGDPNTQRLCTSCSTPKDMGEFYRRKQICSAGDEFFTYCKACARVKSLARYYRKKTVAA